MTECFCVKSEHILAVCWFEWGYLHADFYAKDFRTVP